MEVKSSYYELILKKEWSYTTGAVVIAILAAMLATFSGAWGVFGALPLWGGKLLVLIGINADSWQMYNGSLAKYDLLKNQPAMTDIMLIFGALISSLLAGQWKIRALKSSRQVFAAILGGLLMGIGARIAPGCNVGGMFSSISAYSLSGWVYLVFVFLGAILGGKILIKWFMPPVSHTRKAPSKRTSETARKRNRIIQIILGSVLVFLLLVFSALVSDAYPFAPFILFVGCALGYTLRRSQFCFCSAYRDPVLTGRTTMFKAFLIAIAITSICFAGVHILRYGPDLSQLPEKMPGAAIGLHLCIGAFIFGIGAVLAGGCAAGTLARIGEGYVQSLIALFTFIAGSIIGAPLNNVIQKTPFLYSGQSMYLPRILGGFGAAIILQLLVILLLWIAADKWEAKKTLKKRRNL